MNEPRSLEGWGGEPVRDQKKAARRGYRQTGRTTLSRMFGGKGGAEVGQEKCPRRLWRSACGGRAGGGGQRAGRVVISPRGAKSVYSFKTLPCLCLNEKKPWLARRRGRGSNGTISIPHLARAGAAACPAPAAAIFANTPDMPPAGERSGGGCSLLDRAAWGSRERRRAFSASNWGKKEQELDRPVAAMDRGVGAMDRVCVWVCGGDGRCGYAERDAQNSTFT